VGIIFGSLCSDNVRKACRPIPGFLHLALGDPLQKRNYYRAGWVRFHDDADMTAVMSELSEKKVCSLLSHLQNRTLSGISD